MVFFQKVWRALRSESLVFLQNVWIVLSSESRVFLPVNARNFSSRVNLQGRLSYCVRTALCVQSHASASACMLQIPNTGSHTPCWQEKDAHSVIRNGYSLRCSCGNCGCLAVTQVRRHELPRKRLMKHQLQSVAVAPNGKLLWQLLLLLWWLLLLQCVLCV